MIEIQSMEEWEDVRNQSNKGPIFLLKHSSTCPISAAGYQAFDKFETDIPKYYLVVQKSRPLSQEVESELNVQHQSPQLLLLKDNAAVWHTSHYDINNLNLKSAVETYS